MEKLDEDDDMVTVRFVVSDTGIGISDEARKRLFSPFVQADGSTTRKYGGTGLGLSISKLLADMMDGALDFESAEGRGTTFSFTVPMQKTTAGVDSLAVVAEEQKRKLVGEAALPAVAVTAMTQSDTIGETLRRYLACLGATTNVISSIDDLPRVDGAAQLLFVDGEWLSRAQEDGDRPDPAFIGAIKKFADSKQAHIVFLGVKEDATSQYLLREKRVSRYFLLKPFHFSELVSIYSTIIRRPVPVETEPARERGPIGADQGGAEAEIVQPAYRVFHADPYVLIAEDNNVMQEVAMRQLQKLGLSVHVVANGQAAVEAVRTGKYALVFMDCQMPEMDGYEAAMCIRKEEADRGGHIPIIAMTASAMKGDRENCLAAGMDDYLSKPVNQNHLWTLLEKWLPAALQQAAPLAEGAASAQAPAQSALAADKAAAPPMDFVALERLYGDIDLPHLIDSFLIEGDELLQEISSNLDLNDFGEVARLAHQLKGLAVVMTGSDLANLAVELEGEAKKQSIEPAKVLRNDISEELKKLAQLIEERK